MSTSYCIKPKSSEESSNAESVIPPYLWRQLPRRLVRTVRERLPGRRGHLNLVKVHLTVDGHVPPSASIFVYSTLFSCKELRVTQGDRQCVTFSDHVREGERILLCVVVPLYNIIEIGTVVVEHGLSVPIEIQSAN